MKQWWYGIAGLCILALQACGSQQVPLVVGGNLWLGYQPLYLAEQQGLFRDTAIQLLQMPSNLNTVRAFRRGELQAAALTLDEALLLAESGIPLCIPLVMSFSNGADTVLVRNPEWVLGDLKGKRIGLENTAVAAHMLARALELGELTLSDVTVVPLELDQQYQAFTRSDIDAVISFEPLRSRLLAQGASEVFSSAQIPNEISDLLVVDRRYLEQYPQQVSALVAGWFGGLARVRPAPSAEVMAWLARRSGLDESMVHTGLDLIRFHSLAENRQILADTGHHFRVATRELNEYMLQRRLIGTRLPINTLFCPLDALAVYAGGDA